MMDKLDYPIGEEMEIELQFLRYDTKFSVEIIVSQKVITTNLQQILQFLWA